MHSSAATRRTPAAALGRLTRHAIAVLLAGTLGSATPPANCPTRSTATRSTSATSGRHRLFGVDAPEHDQRCSTIRSGSWDCGAAATERLAALVQGARVQCDAVPGQSDPYGRSISRCTADGTDVAATLVGEGLARAFLRYSRNYEALEKQARQAGIGLWQGAHVAPWEWRRRRR